MKPVVGFALCGSFCTFRRVIEVLRPMTEQYDIIPIFSEASASTDSRFGAASDFLREVGEICGHPVCTTLAEVEPFGPKKLLEALILCPCTGNTLGKLANGIADGPVTLAAKAHLRNGRPIVVAISTNDGLAANAESIGRLLNRKNYFFVPFGQDSPVGKPTSLVADFSQLPDTLTEALSGRQLQPILL